MIKDVQKEIENLEKEMANTGFWENKLNAQKKVKELNLLKLEQSKFEALKKGNAIITIFSGAGGDDAEDFARMLYNMYVKYIGKKGFVLNSIHRHNNEHNGIKNITFEILGKYAYGLLKNESGVHRLVRTSPFSAKKLRHTSFAMVEVIPKFKKDEIMSIPQDEIEVEFTKSSGPGGQNVNKRETAVRIVHIPTGISVHCDSERSQAQNREHALEILKGKLFKAQDEAQKKEGDQYKISKDQSPEWGNQIRSYILHPYKLVKDHRTGIEHNNPENVFEEGDLDLFIEAEQNI